VGECTGPGAPLQGLSIMSQLARRFRFAVYPRGVVLPYEVFTSLLSRYLVPGFRPAVSTASRFSAVLLVATEATTPPLGLDPPSGFTIS
jgi:hypothetical protein